MNLHLWPLAEGLGHRLCVGCIEDVVERILRSFYDIEALLQPCACLGIGDKLVLHTACEVQSGVAGHVSIHEDINLVTIVLGIDAGRVAHVGAARGHHLVVPVVGIAVGLVAVDAEVLLVGCPRFVLHLQGNLRHVGGHTDFVEGCCQFLVAHSLILGLQLCAGGILEEFAALSPCDGIGVCLQRIGVLQTAIDGAIVFPTGSLIVSKHIRIDIDFGARREQIGGHNGRRGGLHVCSLHARAVEHALIQRGHLPADDNRLQRTAIGEGITAQTGHAARDVNSFESAPCKGVGLDGCNRAGQDDSLQFRAFVEHLLSNHVVRCRVVPCVGLSTAHDADARPV